MGFGVPSAVCDGCNRFLYQIREVVLRYFWEERDRLEEPVFGCFVSEFVTKMSLVGWDVSETQCKRQALNLRVNSVDVGVLGLPGLDEIFQCCLIVYIKTGFWEGARDVIH